MGVRFLLVHRTERYWTIWGLIVCPKLIEAGRKRRVPPSSRDPLLLDLHPRLARMDRKLICRPFA
jgi:hypothetical protein